MEVVRSVLLYSRWGGVEVVRSAMLGCGRKWGQLPMGVMQCCNQSQGVEVGQHHGAIGIQLTFSILSSFRGPNEN